MSFRQEQPGHAQLCARGAGRGAEILLQPAGAGFCWVPGLAAIISSQKGHFDEWPDSFECPRVPFF